MGLRWGLVGPSGAFGLILGRNAGPLGSGTLKMSP